MKKLILITVLFFIAATQLVQAQTEKTAFNKTLDVYYNIKNALAKDNLNLAGEGAKTMLTNIQTFPVQNLNAEQKTAWNTQSAELKKAAKQMEFEKDIKVQRKQFETLSYAMIKLVKAFKLNDKTVYLEYCPMAKASWLNETDEIQNPYYGSMMYDCGDVKETIK